MYYTTSGSYKKTKMIIDYTNIVLTIAATVIFIIIMFLRSRSGVLFPIEFLDENRQDKSDDALRKSALVSIIINLEIKWKKNIKMIQINEYSEYINKGLLNELGEIESF